MTGVGRRHKERYKESATVWAKAKSLQESVAKNWVVKKWTGEKVEAKMWD